MPQTSTGRGRAAAAGATAALAWALVEPIDRRVLRWDYSDVALLGKLITRGRGWRVAGLLVHALNGALFGLAFHEVRGRVAGDPARVALGLALAENVALYPLGALVDRYHPRAANRAWRP